MLRNVNVISGGLLVKLTSLLTVFVLTVSVQCLFPVPVQADDEPDLDEIEEVIEEESEEN